MEPRLKLKQKKNTQNVNLNKLTKTYNQHSTLRNVHLCVYHLIQLSYTIELRTVLTIFPLILQKIIIAQMMSTAGGDGIQVINCAMFTQTGGQRESDRHKGWLCYLTDRERLVVLLDGQKRMEVLPDRPRQAGCAT